MDPIRFNKIEPMYLKMATRRDRQLQNNNMSPFGVSSEQTRTHPQPQWSHPTTRLPCGKTTIQRTSE